MIDVMTTPDAICSYFFPPSFHHPCSQPLTAVRCITNSHPRCRRPLQHICPPSFYARRHCLHCQYPARCSNASQLLLYCLAIPTSSTFQPDITSMFVEPKLHFFSTQPHVFISFASPTARQCLPPQPILACSPLSLPSPTVLRTTV